MNPVETAKMRSLNRELRELRPPPMFSGVHARLLAAADHYDNVADCTDIGDWECATDEMGKGAADIDNATFLLNSLPW